MKRILLLSFTFLTVIAFSAMAQRTVSGKVTDDAGETLPGVNVVIKGTTTGTTTDLDGNYRLSVDDGAVLVYSFVGFETQEVAVGARSTIDISMGGATELQEVVVTAVGIESNKASLGYSIQNVGEDDIKNAQETNLVNALNGKVAGVTVVSSSGSPGASSNIRIRGNTSISGSNSPLFVVDGIPVDNSEFGNGTAGVSRSNRAIDLNPNDIENITVLKGAAATVLYGIRAANGAVIINTKKGKKGSMVVRLNSSVRMDEVNKLPELQKTYAQGRAQNGVLTYRGPDTGEGNSWGPRISDLEFDGSDYPYDKNGRLVPAGTGNGVPAKAYDNYDNFFVNGFTYDNTLSVSGGSDAVKYYFSLGHLDQSGIIPNSTWGRTSLKATTSADLTEDLSVSMSANFINSGGFRVQQGSNTSGIMLGLLRTSPTFDNANGYTDGQDAADDVSVYEFPDGTQRSYRGGVYDNPFWVVNNNPFEDNVNRLIGYTALDYKILDWLSVSYKVGLDTYSEEINSAFNINSATQRDGSVTQLARNSRDLNSDFLIKINRNLATDVNLSAVLGHNYFSTQINTQQTVGTTLSVPKFYDISNATTPVGSRGVTQRKLAGVFGQLNFSWRDQVFLNVSGRNDWSSILPKDNNSVFYPAASLGWNFTESLGLSNGAVLSYGKVRASWGQVGNDGGNAFIYATDPYFSGATYGGDGFISSGGNFPFDGTNAFDRNNLLPNGNLKPELTTTTEVGAEIELFSGRLGFDVTYYNTLTEDAIIAVDIAPSSGYNSAVQNVAEISNTGIEAVINGTPVESGDFSWDVSVNFTQYENIVEKLAPGVETVSLAGFVSTTSRAVAGQPYGAIYGSGFKRTSDGTLVIDSNGWPEEVDEDFVLGDPNPDWVAGIRNTLSYKGLSLGMFWDVRQGGDMWNGTFGILKTFGVHEVTAKQREVKGYVFDGVVETGTDSDGNPTYAANTTPVDFYNPRFGIGQNKWNRYAFGGLPEENIQNTSWVRLREVSLGYSLPSSLVSSIGFKSLSLTLVGRNLLLFTEYNGIDPETNLTGASNGIGLDYFNNPNTKSYAFTLNATF
ncbi:TonB-linked outer membrane protein, SusC/RagA family [Ekhidna lutea]|uniref:TonB-linked outer membrane protein, SusC/RagA family n=1 Tax=Ekhidna lutea TaxID=447679 RepID=A0A239KA62_EKHLU|nr:SusC/RagA family TonB-linked outer membrane protein [Ekhidna lutea]SNT14658.1 TonB-linked outer membrane protein, SusC/RagA family [Ekhidna lutea]